MAINGCISAAPIHDAVVNGNLEKVKEIVNKNSDAISQADEEGLYPIHSAVKNPEMLKLLLDLGADPNAQMQPPHMSAGARPLHLTTDKFFDDEHATKVAKHLIKAGADVNVTFGPNITPLLVGAATGKHQFTKTLLENGANPNIQTTSSFMGTPQGATALYAAASEGHTDIVQLFLKHNADPSIQTKEGRTPLDVAKEKEHEEIVKLLEKQKKQKA